ncbi:hypothetical protein PV-S19_0391 [Pacmanvirus S19]|nr:hypothetical protein PV-S19_0391 [Pacmanvirus S19]
MDFRAELCRIAEQLKAAHEIGEELNATDFQSLWDIIENYGDVFLLLCPINDTYHFSLHTRDELGFDLIPRGWFHRPIKRLKFHVLTKNHRNYGDLIEMGWM